MRGDEAELFERYADRLRHSITRAVNTSPDNIEDACAFAWMQLFRKQPERETAFNWLWKVAWHEALRLDRHARRVDELPEEHEQLLDHHGPAAAVEFRLDASERLASLTERQREAFVLRGAGYTYEEAAKRLGVSKNGLCNMIARGALRLRKREQEVDLQYNDDTRPRVRLLQELLREPPAFLQSAIGSPPTGQATRGSGPRRMEWARLALAIVDYRLEHGISDPARPFGGAPRATPERVALEREIATYEAGRPIRGRGLER